ncbi:MAG: fructokinase [Micromonosporaceae bacterium]|nr:fructokinase [Micromonosporaceae bacterium]
MIVVCGEALIDLLPAGPVGGPVGEWRAVCGGGPANTAVALARLGTPARFVGRLAGDAFGRQLRAYLETSGVDLSLAVRAAEPTTLAVVAVDGAGAAEYQFYVNGTADWQWSPAELPAHLPTGTVGLHIGSLATVMAPGAAVLRAWTTGHRDRAVVSYDVNVRPALVGDPVAYGSEVACWLDVAHLVKASDDDVRWLHPGREPLDVARAWLDRHDLTLVLITLGRAGAVAVTRNRDPVRVPGIAVPVVDTVGAGDTFTAALLHYLVSQGDLGVDALDRADLPRALRFAVAAAAIVCTRQGANPPTRAEVDRMLQRG